MYIGAIPELYARNDVILLNQKFNSFGIIYEILDELLKNNAIIGTSSLRR